MDLGRAPRAQLGDYAVDVAWHGLLYPGVEPTTVSEMARHLATVHLSLRLGAAEARHAYSHLCRDTHSGPIAGAPSFVGFVVAVAAMWLSRERRGQARNMSPYACRKATATLGGEMRSSLRACVYGLVVPAVLVVATAFAQPNVEYRNRGNRFEGVRALPVSGYVIELLSFRAIYREDPPSPHTMPPVYRMRFFLDRPASAYVVVREVDNRHSYWLDQVTPATPWRPGFENLFEWPTKDVIRQISLRLDDLGVTVRLGHEHPSDLETVAPAILYYSVPPGSISGYEFAFKTNATAHLEFSIERSDGSRVKPAPAPPVLPMWSYGVPLRVTWDAAGAQAGGYRLMVEGRVLENNQKFRKEIRFFHQPKVR
jgi:hypothetical protein